MRYLRLFYSFFKASLIADLQNRVNFLSRIFTDIFWYASQLIVIEAIYLHTDQIAGWTAPDMRVFLGVLFLMDALFMILFSENFDSISQKIRKGDLDLLLVKPLSSQFVISLQRFNTAIFGNLVLAVCYLTWALSQVPFLWVNLASALLLVPCGLVVCYSIRFFLVCIAVVTTRAENIQFLWYQIYKLGARPDAVYPQAVRRVFLSIIPVAFIASVPARGVLGQLDLKTSLTAVIVAIVLLWLSGKAWSAALRNYTSASS